MILEFEVEGVDPGCRRGGAEAEHIEIGYIVGHGDERLLQALCVVEVKEFSAGQLRGGLGSVGAQ